MRVWKRTGTAVYLSGVAFQGDMANTKVVAYFTDQAVTLVQTFTLAFKTILKSNPCFQVGTTKVTTEMERMEHFKQIWPEFDFICECKGHGQSNI